MATVAELIRMAQSSPYDAGIYDYRNAPLGTFDGEQGLTVPYNAVGEAVVHVRNWSGIIKRQILIEAVSPQRGGVRSTAKGGPYAGKSPEELQRLVKDEGRDMNWYEMKVEPVIFGLRFDGNPIAIHPDLEEVDVKVSEEGQEPRYVVQKVPKWHLVPPGAWDLYMGNWERMNSRNRMERTKEMEQLQARALWKFVMSEENPQGFLEFKREEVRFETRTVDRAKMPAGSIIEV